MDWSLDIFSNPEIYKSGIVGKTEFVRSKYGNIKLDTKMPEIKKDSILAVVHNWGGGSERYIQDVAKETVKYKFVFLRSKNRPGKIATVEMGEYKVDIDMERDMEELVRILRILKVKCVHISQLVCHYIDGIQMMINGLKVPYIVTLSDTLLFPEAQKGDFYMLKDPNGVLKLLGNAPSIVTHTHSTKHEYNKRYPKINIQVIPCQELEYITIKTQIKDSKPIKVVIIGSILGSKGGARIQECANDAVIRKLPITFTVHGGGVNLKWVNMAGPYKSDEELFERLRQDQPHIIWMPGHHFETWSYVLTLAQQSGIPYIIPDMDMFKERNKGLNGFEYYNLQWSPSMINNFIISKYEQWKEPFDISKAKMKHDASPEYTRLYTLLITGRDNITDMVSMGLPEDFDWCAYLYLNKDVLHVSCTKEFAISHWMKHGKRENREYKIEGKRLYTFNHEYYIDSHIDIKFAGINTYEKALRHFLMCGYKEGRKWCKQ